MLTGLWFEVYISLKYKSLTSILQTLVHHVIQHLQCLLLRLRLLALLPTAHRRRHLMLDRWMLRARAISVDHLILLVLATVDVFDLITMRAQHHVLLLGLSLGSTHISHLQSQLVHLHLHASLHSLRFNELSRHLLYRIVRTLKGWCGHGLRGQLVFFLLNQHTPVEGVEFALL